MSKTQEQVAERVTPLLELAGRIALDVVRKTSATFDDLEDLRQSAYVGLCDAANKDDGTCPGTFEAYAVTRMYGEAREHVYRETRKYGLGISDAVQRVDYQPELYSDNRTPERIYQALEIVGKIDKLPERDRELITLLYVDEMSWIDTKKRMRIGNTLMLKKLRQVRELFNVE